MMKLDDDIEYGLPDERLFRLEDKWVISKSTDLQKKVSENLDKFELGVALAKLYDFIWDVFCDWYIELVKQRLGTAIELQCRSYLMYSAVLCSFFIVYAVHYRGDLADTAS